MLSQIFLFDEDLQHQKAEDLRNTKDRFDARVQAKFFILWIVEDFDGNYMLDGLYGEDVVGYMYMPKEKFKEIARMVRGKEVEVKNISRADEEQAHRIMTKELQEFNDYLKEV